MMDFETGKKNLEKLISQYSEIGVRNEAETRFHFIDVLLTECLGWERNSIPVEKYLNGERSDYELGNPTAIILEAKRDSINFEIPVRKNDNFIISISHLIALGDAAAAVINQVQGYCANRGVRYAAISNGHQFILFVGSRTDGKSPFDGKALVFDGFQQLLNGFGLLFNFASPMGAASNKLLTYLDANGVTGIPAKVSTKLAHHPSFRYQSASQNSLRMIAELLLEDIARTKDIGASCKIHFLIGPAS